MTSESRDLPSELESLARDIEDPGPVNSLLVESAALIRRLTALAVDQAHAIATLQETCSAIYQAWEDGDDGLGGSRYGDEDDDEDDLDTDDDGDEDAGPITPLPGQMSFLDGGETP